MKGLPPARANLSPASDDRPVRSIGRRVVAIRLSGVTDDAGPVRRARHSRGGITVVHGGRVGTSAGAIVAAPVGTRPRGAGGARVTAVGTRARDAGVARVTPITAGGRDRAVARV